MPSPARPIARPITWALALAGGFALARALRRRHAAAPATPARHHYGTAHEPTDMSGRLMIGLVAGLGLVVALVIGLMLVIHGRLRHDAGAARPAYTALQQAPVPPPAPNLQADPLQDIAAFQKAQAAELSSYAWTAPDHRAARIPIERAKSLLVGHPLDPAP